MSSVYVLAVLGEYPAVLTELLWWLSKVERRAVAGIEVWTTRMGDQRLRELVADPAWDALQDAVGVLPSLEPRGTGPAESHGFRSHVFVASEVELDDVRSEDECTAVSAALHDRVRALRRGLAAPISIVGSLAGGRKTMSAALQTAFSLQARKEDRLVHTILHAQVEAVLQRERRGRDYVFPTAHWADLTGVAEAEQLVVYDVSVPRIRSIAETRLVQVLDEESYADVWPALTSSENANLRAVLQRTPAGRWAYRIRDADSGEMLYDESLPNRLGSVLAAMALSHPDVSALEILGWLDSDDELVWSPPSSSTDTEEMRVESVRHAVSDLRTRLSGIPAWLQQFAPPQTGYTMQDVDVILEP